MALFYKRKKKDNLSENFEGNITPEVPVDGINLSMEQLRVESNRKNSFLKRLWGILKLTRIDRYIIGKFLGTFFFSLLLIISIAIVFDFNEHLDRLSTSHATWQQIVVYYLNYMPYFANLLSPLFVFISVILFTTKLADNSEIIAMRSNGMSFRRLLKPYMISAAIIALCNFYLGGYLIPHSNEYRVEFESKYIKRKKVTEISNVQLQVAPGVVAFIQNFNIETKQGYNFSLDKFDKKKLVSHLTASRIQYDTLSEVRNRWKLTGYSLRNLKGMHEEMTSGAQLDTIIDIEPSDILYTNKQQETMTNTEIKSYILKQKARGAANVNLFEVEYYKRFASLFAAFILTFIGVSLSCEKKKGGMGLSLGAGLALSFTYILFFTISSTFAINTSCPPLVAVWIPNIIFVFVGMYLYKHTPK